MAIGCGWFEDATAKVATVSRIGKRREEGAIVYDASMHVVVIVFRLAMRKFCHSSIDTIGRDTDDSKPVTKSTATAMAVSVSQYYTNLKFKPRELHE